ncbi:kelch-like protein 24 [Branchiostoma lanceolatum]|uniref:kelch-like protein 24 n=1 Tax=Branchiostoma lanceolatum TaxID=7740 RepID=UPI0034511F93
MDAHCGMDVCPDTSVDSCFAGWFFKSLRSLRSEGLLVDVTLCAEGKEIPCHRVVLATCSDYFKAMFGGSLSESKKDKIEMGGVSVEALQQLVDYAYTSKVNVTEENVRPLFVAANMLQFAHVETACEKFLIKSLSPTTCMGTWALGHKMSSEWVSDRARHCAIKNFEEACKTEEFLELPLDILETYISEDGLHAKKEERVLEVVMLWVRHDLKERQKHLEDLLESVCFSSMDQDYLKNILKKDKVLGKVPGVKKLTEDQSLHRSPREISQNDILVLGGVKDHYLNRTISLSERVYRLELDSHCVDSNPLPQQIRDSQGFAACVLDKDVIVTGGNKSLRQAWRYRPSQKSWKRLASLKTGRYGHGMAVCEGKVYVVGGCSHTTYINTHILSDVEVYNERTNRWKKVAPLELAVSNFALTECSGILHVFGGVIEPDRHTKTDSVQWYDPTSNEWRFGLQMPAAMANLIACTVNYEIYLLGGPLKCVIKYMPWLYYEDLADKLAPWDHCSATVCGSEIYITGGQSEPEMVEVERSQTSQIISSTSHFHCDNHATVQCYDTNYDTMVKVKDLPLALDGHCTVTVPKDLD